MRRLWLIILLVLSAAVQSPAQDFRNMFKRSMLPGEYADNISNLFLQHRWAKGKEQLDKALEYYPEDAELHYLAGRYWWNGKNYDKARYHLVKACQINYHYTDAKTLLVNVEEVTGNYSSAICYVNELLELNPYWKGLWLRKVDLYRRLGNFDEANTLLKRLSQIYPNDASISSDYFDVLETTYKQARMSGDLGAAEVALREVVRITPSDIDYQLAYANILIQRGKMNDALDNLMAAISVNPGNVQLVKKACDILMDSGKSMSALALVRTQMSQFPSAGLERLYQNLLAESARIENEADAYQLYARSYISNPTPESLEYLLTQSVKRGYYDDAIHYIGEMRRRKGDSPRWYMMEYDVYTRMGSPESALKALEDGVSKYPKDYDINLAICRRRLALAADEMDEGRYTQAIPLLEFVRKSSVEPELQAVAVRRLAVCYRETGQEDLATLMLRERLKTDPEYQVTMDYAALLVKMGKTEAALQTLHSSYLEAKDSVAVKLLASAYKETAYPYLKERTVNGSIGGLSVITGTILSMDPDDYWGLWYSLKTAEDPLPYALRGMEAYPGDLTFPIKAASIYASRDMEEEAIALLRPYLADFPADEDLLKTYAAVSDSFGGKLLKAKDTHRAKAVLDSALAVRPLDADLRYTRGLVYERDRQWDSAYVYQKNYRPSVLEEEEFISRMKALRSRTLRNTLEMGGDLYRYTNTQHLMAIGTLAYGHNTRKNEFMLSLNYTARDADFDTETDVYLSNGGRGFQVQGAWENHSLKHFSLRLKGAYGIKYFPVANADVTGTIHWKNDWDTDLGFNFRYLQDGGLMYAGNLGITHSWSNMYAGLKGSVGTVHDILFYNASARYRFYPIDGGRSYLEAQAGAGTAPEIDFLDMYYTSAAFNHLNSFVAATAAWAVYHNLLLNFSLSWNTLYNQTETVTYRNLLIAHVSATLYF